MTGASPPAKPEWGEPCNGCGVCCAAECCPLAIVAFRRRRGPCPALAWSVETRSYRCGLLGKAPRLLRGLVARWIAAGQGCDSQAEVGRIFPDRRPPA